MCFLKEGYRLPKRALEYADEDLRDENKDLAARGWEEECHEDRREEIERELALFEAALAIGNRVPDEDPGLDSKKVPLKGGGASGSAPRCGAKIGFQRAEHKGSPGALVHPALTTSSR